MMNAEFFCKSGRITGFCVSGHADFDRYGKDIVCASVSSAVQLTVNGITEILCCKAQVKVEENAVSLSVKDDQIQKAEMFLQAFKLHLELLAEDYPGTIQISCMEV